MSQSNRPRWQYSAVLLSGVCLLAPGLGVALDIPSAIATSPQPQSPSPSGNHPPHPAAPPQATPPAEPPAPGNEPAHSPASPAETDPATHSTTDSVADPETDSKIIRQGLLSQGDRFYLQGQLAEAEVLYRQAKGDFGEQTSGDRPPTYSDPATLPPAGRVYWRETEAGRAANLPSRILVPLQLLSEQYPEFVPGSIAYAQALVEQDQPEEALAVLERVTSRYPDSAELVKARVEVLAQQNQWMDASIAARQFALLYPEQPAASELLALADAHLETFQRRTRTRLRENAIANVFTGAIGFALTGSLFGPLSAIQTTVLLLRGESAIGESVAKDVKREFDLIEDEATVAYVNAIGQRLAKVAGRDFNYEFYIIKDKELNAFALPGGKIFIHAGAIAKTNSEAELAGLLAHEISHTVLSHGFQLATNANVNANIFQFFPYVGGLATDLSVTSYSREMERQARSHGHPNAGGSRLRSRWAV